METMRKFELEITGVQKVRIPRNCQLLSVTYLNGCVCLWARVETTSSETDIEIEIFKEGDFISNAGEFRRIFIGTVTTRPVLEGFESPEHVLHVFERQQI